MKRIKLKMGITSVVITAVVVACVIMFNAMVALLGEKLPLTIDLTGDKVYEFSDRTKDLMKNLDKEVCAYALIPEGTSGEYVDYIKAYLDKYEHLSKNFKVKYIDPYQDPAFMNQYSDEKQQAGIGSVIIECENEFKVVPFEQIYTQSNITKVVEIDMEKKVTNAIMSVTGNLSPAKIYFTEGHGEYIPQNMKALLMEEGYECESINLSVNSIAKDANVVFSVVPMEDFTAKERDALDDFLDRGGRFILVTYPAMKPMKRLDGYMAEWGLNLNYDYVVETDSESSLSAGQSIPIPIAKLQEHTITTKLASSKSPLALPEAMSISVGKTKNGSSVTKLLMTSPGSYGKKNLNSETLKKEAGDVEGPLCLSAISEKSGESNSAVMILGSLSAFESAQIINEGAFLNGDYLLNSVSYLCGIREAGAIRAKQISAEKMTMTQKQVVISMLILQYVLPVIILLAGLFVWLRRRNK